MHLPTLIGRKMIVSVMKAEERKLNSTKVLLRNLVDDDSMKHTVLLSCQDIKLVVVEVIGAEKGFKRNYGTL